MIGVGSGDTDVHRLRRFSAVSNSVCGSGNDALGEPTQCRSRPVQIDVVGVQEHVEIVAGMAVYGVLNAAVIVVPVIVTLMIR